MAGDGPHVTLIYVHNDVNCETYYYYVWVSLGICTWKVMRCNLSVHGLPLVLRLYIRIIRGGSTIMAMFSLHTQLKIRFFSLNSNCPNYSYHVIFICLKKMLQIVFNTSQKEPMSHLLYQKYCLKRKLPIALQSVQKKSHSHTCSIKTKLLHGQFTLF